MPTSRAVMHTSRDVPLSRGDWSPSPRQATLRHSRLQFADAANAANAAGRVARERNDDK